MYYYLNEDYVIEASYAPDLTSAFKLANGKLASTNPNYHSLEAGLTYRVLAFDKETDALVADVIYHIGDQQITPMELEAEKKYKFVALCLNVIPQEMPNYTPLEPYFIIPKIEYVDPDNPVLTGAKVVSLSAGLKGEENLLGHLPYMASHIPLSFFRTDDYPALSATNINYLNIVFKQLFCQVNVNVDLSSSIYTSYDERISFNGDNVLKALNLNFSLVEKPNLLSFTSVPDWSFQLMRNKYTFYLTEDDNSGLTKDTKSVESVIELKLRNGVKEEVRYLTIDNMEFKNGYRYNLNLRVLPGSEVPVGYDVIRLTEEVGFDKEEEVLW